MYNYDDLLKELALHRESLDAAKKQKADILEAVKSQPHYLAADAIALAANAAIEELEKTIRDAALYDYAATGNKTVHDKVKIKVFQKLQIVDPVRVLTWVKTNLADALIFDEKKVKSYATKIGNVDGIEITEEPQAQIASEL